MHLGPPLLPLLLLVTILTGRKTASSDLLLMVRCSQVEGASDQKASSFTFCQLEFQDPSQKITEILRDNQVKLPSH